MFTPRTKADSACDEAIDLTAEIADGSWTFKSLIWMFARVSARDSTKRPNSGRERRAWRACKRLDSKEAGVSPAWQRERTWALKAGKVVAAEIWKSERRDLAVPWIRFFKTKERRANLPAGFRVS